MIPQDIRKCHNYAISFLKSEIQQLKDTLADKTTLDSCKPLLLKRLEELENDFEYLTTEYNFI